MNYMFTRSQQIVDLDDPDPSTINIEDIAYSLSNIARFAGHVGDYSVAQHSLVCANLAEGHPTYALYYLLHDAHEAYIGDIPGPVKRILRPFPSLALRISKLNIIIHKAAGLAWPPEPLPVRSGITNMDAAVLNAEIERFFSPELTDRWREDNPDFWDAAVELGYTMSSHTAEIAFLRQYERLRYECLKSQEQDHATPK